MDFGGTFGGHQNPSNVEAGHSCINMILVSNVVKRAKDYGSSQPKLGKEHTPPEVPLHIEKPKVIPRIPKGLLKCSAHNPNAQDAQHYSIFKDLGQNTYAMSYLEVLHTFPLQRKALLNSLGMVDSHPSTVIRFETHKVQPLFP